MDMNLGDPELELVDPTPNIHSLFLHFDQLFFWSKLASRAVVRWSKRMYSCAGVCSYDRGGLCDIALSEPLLKLRPRKDLIQTLLHEMIHAYLFITCRDRDRDGHGPNFKAHMNRINRAAGLNISIYHDFYEEVELYKTHWWRCNGLCQTLRPHFGIVRRSVNKAPGPTDHWWEYHQRKCGGTFVKIKEPENYGNKKKRTSPSPCWDIIKYINANNDKGFRPVLINKVPVKSNQHIKSNSSSTFVVSKTKNIVFSPKILIPQVNFSGNGESIGSRRTSSSDVVDTVRNVWSNKQLSPNLHNKLKIPSSMSEGSKNSEIPRRNSISTTPVNSNKQKADSTHIQSPPTKIKKIDDYFKSTAVSLLKDLYGKEFEIKETHDSKRLSAVSIDSVDCPVCNSKISSDEINRHLDECLNKEVIDSIQKDNIDTEAVIQNKPDTNQLKNDRTQSTQTVLDNLLVNFIKKESNNKHPINIKTENNSIDLYKGNDLKNDKDVNSNIIEKKYSEDINKSEILKKEEQNIPLIKMEPSTSKDVTANDQKCPCCSNIVDKPINEHLEECLAFFNNTTVPTEGASTSFANETIIIDDDDDIFDETLKLNATGTKAPCPCCLKMIEQADMNNHLDLCLS